jgi:hypothetical protein
MGTTKGTHTSTEGRGSLANHAWCVGHDPYDTGSSQVARVIPIESTNQMVRGLPRCDAHKQSISQPFALKGYHSCICKSQLDILWLCGNDEDIW